MSNFPPRRTYRWFAAIVVPLCAVALTACEPECVDKFDCRGKGAPGEEMTCVDNQCVTAPPKPDSGVTEEEDAGTQEDAGIEQDAGVQEDAGTTDAGETDAGETDAGEIDAGQADAGLPIVHLVATLNEFQLEPPTNGSEVGEGSFYVDTNLLTDGGHNVVYAVSWGDAGVLPPTPAATSIEIRHAPGGRNGPVVATLAGGLSSPLGGNFTVSATQAQWILHGDTYVVINSLDSPAGFVRGQILFPQERFYVARLNATEAGTDSLATGGAHIILPVDGGMVRYFGQWDELDGGATMAHVHAADAGLSGPPILPLTLLPDGGGVWGSADAGILDEVELNEGHDYVNAHSVGYPNGEIRGQLERKN